MWRFRPLAFRKDYTRLASRDKLLGSFRTDNARAIKEGVVPPPPPPRASNTTITSRPLLRKHQLRTCQWNVRFFCPMPWTPDSYKLAVDIVNVITDTEPDVIVLNEFGDDSPASSALASHQKSPANSARQILQDLGYTFHIIAECNYPTAIATKLPLTNQKPISFSLDESAGIMDLTLRSTGRILKAETRDAVALQVQVPSIDEEDDKSDKNSRPVWIYATHLDDSDDMGGEFRREEMESILVNVDDKDPVLLLGTLNQQRKRDYLRAEWDLICDNKAMRGSPEDDGVAGVLKDAGFQCVWDDIVLKQCNWQPEEATANASDDDEEVDENNNDDASSNPPPATHWTGTIVDYAYFRGSSVNLRGVYVSPCDLSDHRMVVCDWDIAANTSGSNSDNKKQVISNDSGLTALKEEGDEGEEN